MMNDCHWCSNTKCRPATVHLWGICSYCEVTICPFCSYYDFAYGDYCCNEAVIGKNKCKKRYVSNNGIVKFITGWFSK